VTWTLDADRTWLEFEVRRLGVPTLRGRFDRFAVAIRPDAADPDTWALDLKVAAASIATGNAARDARLAGGACLDAARYPDVVFQTRHAEPLHDIENSLTRLNGDLTIRGTTREATWEFELLDRALGVEEVLGAEYVGRLEFVPRQWGLRSAWPLPRPKVTVTLRLTVLAADRGVDDRSEEIAPAEVVPGATTTRSNP
jgi:polyisoprenoid-binding protein YceI